MSLKLNQLPETTTDHIISSREIINCTRCKKELIELIITKTLHNKTHKYQVICPCKSTSFTKTVIGHANIKPCGKLKLKNIITTDITIIEVTDE